MLIIILNILIPPLAVALRHGIGSAFLINVLLTLLGWIPGMIHAFYVNNSSGGGTTATRGRTTV